MSKCRNCNIEILDNTGVCPLCHCVVEKDGTERESAYPEVWIREKKIGLVIRIYLFLAVAAEALLVFINVQQQGSIWWSAITAGVFFYIYLVMKVGIQNETGYRNKIILFTAAFVILIYMIDRVIGYRGWSLNYVLPAGVLMINLAIMLLMIVNWKNWPSYLLFQIFCILCSMLPIFLWKKGVITKPFLSEIALADSVLLFLGTVIIGGSRARIELKRRFHV